VVTVPEREREGEAQQHQVDARTRRPVDERAAEPPGFARAAAQGPPSLVVTDAYIGFPIKLVGGSGAPIRAVAVFAG